MSIWKSNFILETAKTTSHNLKLFFIVKFIYSEKANFAKSSPYFWLQYIQSKVSWRFRKIVWPSQNIWTLLCKCSICLEYLAKKNGSGLLQLRFQIHLGLSGIPKAKIFGQKRKFSVFGRGKSNFRFMIRCWPCKRLQLIFLRSFLAGLLI